MIVLVFRTRDTHLLQVLQGLRGIRRAAVRRRQLARSSLSHTAGWRGCRSQTSRPRHSAPEAPRSYPDGDAPLRVAPWKAIVLRVDEKSQIRSTRPDAPVLPLRPPHAVSDTHLTCLTRLTDIAAATRLTRLTPREFLHSVKGACGAGTSCGRRSAPSSPGRLRWRSERPQPMIVTQPGPSTGAASSTPVQVMPRLGRGRPPSADVAHLAAGGRTAPSTVVRARVTRRRGT